MKLSFERVFPLFALTFVDVLGLTLILPLLHLYAAAFGASPLEIGLVAAAFPLAQVIGVPVMGALSDRYGRKPLLLISQITTCISFLMLAAANSLALVLLSRLIDGLFGANLATAQAAITDITDDETRAQGLGITGAAFGLGFLLGPAIAFGTLEVTNSLSTPALVAAVYSFISILITLFMFRETLPPERRAAHPPPPLFVAPRLLRRPQVKALLGFMIAQQIVFYGFEALLGLFVLSRLGLLAQGNSLIFIYVGFWLVLVQARMIGRWRRKYGERRMVIGALALLGVGLLLMAATPESPHPLYIRSITEDELLNYLPNATEAVIGDIQVELPRDENRGFGGLLWMLIALIPVAIGAGIMRPALNSLLTKRVDKAEYGSILGVSASAVSLADGIAPIFAGLLFQSYGASAHLAVGGAVMLALALVARAVIKQPPEQTL